MSSAKKAFSFLEGKWGLIRSTNGFGSMKGEALFMPLLGAPSFLSYREEGIFETLYGEGLLFYREYMYVLNDEEIDIYFASHQKKQHLFHTLSFLPHKNSCSASVHLCGKDLYVPTYTFLDKDSFALEYRVKGPKKDLIIQSLFQRRLR